MTEHEKLEHYWNWFSLHSTQRMQSINFFLVATSFLVVGYVDATVGAKDIVAIAVSSLGVILAFVFFRLDRRTRYLIQSSESRIADFQAEIEPKATDDLTKEEKLGITLLKEVELATPGSWTYSTAFAWFFGTVGSMFALGTIYSVVRLATPAAQAAASPQIDPNLAKTGLACVTSLVFLAASVELFYSWLRGGDDRSAKGFAPLVLSLILLGVCLALLWQVF